MTNGSRIVAAISFLREGKSFNVGNLRLGIVENDDIEVAGWSQFKNLDNISKSTSLQELRELKVEFQKMLAASESLEAFLAGRNIVFALYFDDYGKASIAICSEKDGELKWLLDLE